jgi:probable HAF family extracellular repeat protein
MTDLGTLGGDQSWAWGVNSLGQVVGWSEIEPGSDVRHAFLWEKGTMTDLGTLGCEHSMAYAINALGQVVGKSATASGAEHAVLWDK